MARNSSYRVYWLLLIRELRSGHILPGHFALNVLQVLLISLVSPAPQISSLSPSIAIDVSGIGLLVAMTL